MKRRHFVVGAILYFFANAMSQAHDLWIETQSAVVRAGELVHVDFKLGNCNDGRRDFTTSGLIDPSGILSGIISPSRSSMELIDKFSHSAKKETEGFWSKNLTIREKGMSWIVQSLDQIIEHDGVKMQGIVTAKAFVIASESLDHPNDTVANGVLDLPIEFALESSPLPTLEGGAMIRVRLLRDSNPQESVRVSFLPQGIDLQKEDDASFERKTDVKGIAEFKPDRAGLYLISARIISTNKNANGPKETYYSTSLTLRVSNREILQSSKAIATSESSQLQNAVADSKSAVKQMLDAIRQSMLTGARNEAEKAAVKLQTLAKENLSNTERELWLRLSREAAVRLGDREGLESLRSETDSFETQLIYRILLASGQLEKGELDAAAKTLDELGDIEVLNEREKRRVFAIRARLAQLHGDVVQERVHIESIIDHLDRWPTTDCQSCHNAPATPKAITSLPIHRFWFGERFVELMKKQNDAEAIRLTSEKELAADSTNDRARIRLAYAYRALGNDAKAKQLFESIPWVEKEGRELLMPRMMTTFP